MKTLKFLWFTMLFMLIALFIAYNYIEQVPSICRSYKDIYQIQLDSGVVIKKFINYENHAKKTVLIKEGNKTYEIFFLLKENYSDFERINLMDKISKPANSLLFKVNNLKQFEFIVECGAYLKE
jgi:hypothetical protein